MNIFYWHSLSLSWHNTCKASTVRLKCTFSLSCISSTPLTTRIDTNPTTSSSKAGSDVRIQCLENGTFTMGRKKHPCQRESDRSQTGDKRPIILPVLLGHSRHCYEDHDNTPHLPFSHTRIQCYLSHMDFVTQGGSPMFTLNGMCLLWFWLRH